MHTTFSELISLAMMRHANTKRTLALFERLQYHYFSFSLFHLFSPSSLSSINVFFLFYLTLRSFFFHFFLLSEAIFMLKRLMNIVCVVRSHSIRNDSLSRTCEMYSVQLCSFSTIFTETKKKYIFLCVYENWKAFASLLVVIGLYLFDRLCIACVKYIHMRSSQFVSFYFNFDVLLLFFFFRFS